LLIALIDAAVTERSAKTGVIVLNKPKVSELAFLGTIIVEPGNAEVCPNEKMLLFAFFEIPFG
jgi:hypothetical protein